MAAVAKVEEKKAAPGRTVRIAGMNAPDEFRPRTNQGGTETLAGTTKTNFNPRCHGLFDAFQEAYSNHHGVSVRPDDLRLAILQGVSTTVERAPEKYREALGVQHKGKEEVEVRNDTLQLGEHVVHEEETVKWATSLPEFKTRILARLGGSLLATLMKPFSTTTPLDEVTSAVTLMSVCKAYLAYVIRTRCGIPSIHFAGTKADWELLLEMINSLTVLGLDWWVNPMKHAVGRILGLFADGQPDELEVKNAPISYWHNIYNCMRGGSGRPDKYNGWIFSFMPYIDTKGTRADFSTTAADLDSGEVLKTRLELNNLPGGHREVDALWIYEDHKIPIVLSAGFSTATYDAKTNVVTPQVGWCIFTKEQRLEEKGARDYEKTMQKRRAEVTAELRRKRKEKIR